MEKSTQMAQFRRIILNACTIPCGLPLILLFFLKIGQMVICPVRGTYNHETNLTRVNSSNNNCFKLNIHKSTQTHQFRGNTANACTIPGGSPLTLFLKICRMVICPVKGTYITTYMDIFCSKMKKGLKITSRAKFGRLNVYICSKLLSSLRKLKFYPELSHDDMYKQRDMLPRD